MTVGENIRRIRKERGLTQRQLGELVGASEAYIRAYESGRRNPKPASIEKIAEALSVNPEVLQNSEFDGIAAMHKLFQIFRQYSGNLFEYQDEDGNDMVAINFGTLALMRSWYERYEQYMQEVEKANDKEEYNSTISDKKGQFMTKAEFIKMFSKEFEEDTQKPSSNNDGVREQTEPYNKGDDEIER